MALLEGRNLRKTYKLGRKNEVQALRGVAVSIEAGELVALMGPSGSGKSTLMHLLGLLHSPDQNHGPAPELSFGGRDATRMSDGERTRIRAREMGFVFQQFNLVPTLTAVENVMLAGEYAGLGRREARERAIARLNMVGLAERATHRPSELSGGEQQRVAIARALVNDPALVLADEPTGNLDSHRSAELLGLIRKLNREHGQTFVLVTHDAEVGAACDRIIRMRDGLVQAVELVDEPTLGRSPARPWRDDPYPAHSSPLRHEPSSAVRVAARIVPSGGHRNEHGWSSPGAGQDGQDHGRLLPRIHPRFRACHCAGADRVRYSAAGLPGDRHE